MTALPKEIAALIDDVRAVARLYEPGSMESLAARGRLERAILADRERLAAESEARRLVLVLKATELRQESLRAERAEEALRDLLDLESMMIGGVTHKGCDRSPCAWCVARAVLSPLPAPQPAPEVKP